jgi:hypothetical protein
MIGSWLRALYDESGSLSMLHFEHLADGEKRGPSDRATAQAAARSSCESRLLVAAWEVQEYTIVDRIYKYTSDQSAASRI